MLCQKCKQKEAVYHSTLIVNGQSQTTNLCEDCARSEGYLKDTNEFFNNFFKEFDSMFSQSIFDGLFCPSCNTNFTDFKNHKFLGCEDCFDVFKNDVDALLNGFSTRIDDDKIEFNTPKKSKDEQKLEELKASLQNAIKDERYEDAADINKQIKNLQNKINNNQ